MYKKYLFQFPSPFGVRVLKYEFFQHVIVLTISQFPSPFGVRVLKLKAEPVLFAYIRRGVSVPFRGSCSEILNGMFYKNDSAKVSVPFRGSCSEMEY